MPTLASKVPVESTSIRTNDEMYLEDNGNTTQKRADVSVVRGTARKNVKDSPNNLVGDGTTSDLTNFTSLVTGGGNTFYFPQGTFNIPETSGFTPSTAFRIIGELREKVTIKGSARNTSHSWMKPGSGLDEGDILHKDISFDTLGNIINLDNYWGGYQATIRLDNVSYTNVASIIRMYPPSTWATSTSYSVGNVVRFHNQDASYDGKYYRCLEAHTSGTFATDLAANKWIEVTGETLIESLNVQNVSLTSGLEGLVINGPVKNVQVNNFFADGLQRWGVALGSLYNDGAAYQQYLGNMDNQIYTNVIIRNISKTGTGEINNFYAAGRYVSVIGLILDGMTAPDSSDAEGLYSKIIAGSFIGGHLKKASGSSQGMLSLKGAQADPANNVQDTEPPTTLNGMLGERNLVMAYHFEDDPTDTSTRDGIWIQCPDVILWGITYKHFGGRAVYGINSSEQRNQVHGVQIIDRHRGEVAYRAFYNIHQGFLIADKIIVNRMTGSQTVDSSSTELKGIEFSSAGELLHPLCTDCRVEFDRGTSFGSRIKTGVYINASISDWVTSTAYSIGSVRKNGGSYYRCIVAHTSGTFATDLSNGYWVLLAGTLAYGRVSGFVPVNATNGIKIRTRNSTSINGLVIENCNFSSMADPTLSIVYDKGSGGTAGAASTIKIRNCEGIVTKNKGQGTIANGTSSITVNHGLTQLSGFTATPGAGDITIIPRTALVTATYWYISAISATQFTLTASGNVGADFTFDWIVEKESWTSS